MAHSYGDTCIARMTVERGRQDLQLARDCHMNLLRMHAHVDHPALNDAADELGIVLWQDFPLQWLYRRAVLPEARRQAKTMVNLLGNHPSVAVWCMHTGGILPFMFADSNPAVQWAIVDYWRVPKASYWALCDAFRPQYAWTLLDADVYRPGQEIVLPIYVANDAHVTVDYALEAQVLDPAGVSCAAARCTGTLPPDCLPHRATTIALTPRQSGEYRLEIVLKSAGSTLTNTYQIHVSAMAGP